MRKRASQGTQLTGLEAEWPESSGEIRAVVIKLIPDIRYGLAVNLMEKWSQYAILNLRHVLEESLQEGNERRSTYARWMLSTVLEDPAYKGQVGAVEFQVSRRYER